MSSSWPRIEELFFELVELSAEARGRRIEELRARDPRIAAEVESLLAADAAPTLGIEAPGPATRAVALGPPRSAEANTFPGMAVGAWILEAPIGRGGMGSVWSARRNDAGFEQRAAVKLVPAESSARVLARFAQERRTLSRLEHPGIARLIDGGALQDGRPYLVMELVEGASIDRWCDEHALAVRARVELFLAVCAAVEHAHKHLVVHRDLKPANVLVEAAGRPKLLDFGIAKLLEDDDDRAVKTLEHERLLTPRYASPEQVRGERVSTASDVYSLGVVLHELLTGAGPYASGTNATHELARAICELPPARPSAAVGAGEDAEGRARRRGTTARALARELRGDLDAIVLTAMRKEPERRYASVERLADDLARFLAGRPVAAKGESFSYRARKLAARHRFATGALLLALFVLVSAAIAVGISARTAKARLVEVQRLSDLRQLTDLRARAEELWPARPTQLPGMQAWLEAARTLHDRGTDHASALERLRARALPYDAQQRELDRAGHPRRSELDAARVRLASLRWRLEHESGDVRALPERIATLEREIGELEHAVLERRTWAFTDPADRWEHDELVQLLDELAGFAAPKSGAIDRMRSRAELAEALEKDLGDTHAEAWRAAIATIGDPARAPHYGGLVLTPQIGLAPLGPDPESGLWEFAELSTGRPPERGADGRLAIGEETALVLVLLPGGRARIGSAAPGTGDDPDDEDRLTRADEQPPNAVELAPFFLSKYEMTQGQWLRFSGSNPSAIAPGQQHGDHTTGLGHPVEHMSWEEADTMLWRMGLVLPTEAQWEYAARAGTRTAWWTGDDRDALEGAANIADAAARRVGAPWPAIREWPEHDDGHVVHASVGTYRPNPFGLHDTAGNVWEWCLDEYALYDLPTEPRTGLRQWKGGREHCGRGGSYMEGAASTRSAHRGHAVLGAREASIGVRPARVVE